MHSAVSPLSPPINIKHKPPKKQYVTVQNTELTVKSNPDCESIIFLNEINTPTRTVTIIAGIVLEHK